MWSVICREGIADADVGVSMQFVTDSGVRVPMVTTEQMREIDRIAIDETGPNLFQMMENAGRSLAEVAMGMLSGTRPQGPIIVLAGTGGNGGGGICAARHIANRGLDVRVVLTDQTRLGAVPAAQLEVFSSTPGTVIQLPDLEDVDPALVIDAVIGYSIDGAPRGRALDLLEWCTGVLAPVLSLDVPSGIEATSGTALGQFIGPNRTLTLALPKTGLVNIPGELVLADLGIPSAVFKRMGIDVPSELFLDGFVVPIHRAA